MRIFCQRPLIFFDFSYNCSHCYTPSRCRRVFFAFCFVCFKFFSPISLISLSSFRFLSLLFPNVVFFFHTVISSFPPFCYFFLSALYLQFISYKSLPSFLRASSNHSLFSEIPIFLFILITSKSG